jgi:TatA/E family protein of Tat protein translocase
MEKREMNVFGMGPMEVALILVVALIVFGPGRLPEIGSALGRGIREFRKVTTDLTKEVTREIEALDTTSKSEASGSNEEASSENKASK